MSKTYYIFLSLVFFVSLGLGFFLSTTFYCKNKEGTVLSLKDISTDSKTKSKGRLEACDLFIDVSGAVVNPGVVCLNEGAIVNDAIQKADGFNSSAYAFKYVAQRINLARILENEEKIYIPFRDDIVCNLVDDPQIRYVENLMKVIQNEVKDLEVVKDAKKENISDISKEKEDCISINNASKEKIMELSGIGEAKATEIIEARPYSKLEDIKEVSGIGEKTFENIKDFICL